MHTVFHAMFVFHLFTQGDPGEYSVSPVSLEVIFKRNINQLLKHKEHNKSKKNILPVFHWDH